MVMEEKEVLVVVVKILYPVPGSTPTLHLSTSNPLKRVLPTLVVPICLHSIPSPYPVTLVRSQSMMPHMEPSPTDASRTSSLLYCLTTSQRLGMSGSIHKRALGLP